MCKFDLPKIPLCQPAIDLKFLGLVHSFELSPGNKRPVPALMMRARVVRLGEGRRKQSRFLEGYAGIHASDTVIVVSRPRQLPARPAERYLPQPFCGPAFTSRTAPPPQVHVILHFQEH